MYITEPVWAAPEKYVSLAEQGLAPPPPPTQTNQTHRQTNGASNMVSDEKFMILFTVLRYQSILFSNACFVHDRD